MDEAQRETANKHRRSRIHAFYVDPWEKGNFGNFSLIMR
jgi:hypothetical protein